MRLILNVIWLLFGGLWLAIGHILIAVAMAATIVGIPLALANLTLIPVSLMPLDEKVVAIDSEPRRRGPVRWLRRDADRHANGGYVSWVM